MKTDDLVAMLATGVTPVPPRAAARRLALALALGLLLSFAILGLGYGVRPDLRQAMRWPMLWVKLLFPACIAAAGFVMLQRLARPGVRVRWSWLGIALPVAAVWGLAAIVWAQTPTEARMPMLLAPTWQSCAFSICLIGLPVFAAALLALRSLAPMQPALVGAAAGAMAGGAGGTVYALHCLQLAAPFLAVWYVGGIALAVMAGAMVGRRALRW